MARYEDKDQKSHQENNRQRDRHDQSSDKDSDERDYRGTHKNQGRGRA